jgi:hypothetical protein
MVAFLFCPRVETTFGTVFDSKIAANVAVSAQQSCCMQVRAIPPATAAAPAVTMQSFVLNASAVVRRVLRNIQPADT